jgi:hypothetical protein
MGYYINPNDMTKEEFLRRYGTRLDRAPDTFKNEKDEYAVCLVDNGAFTAAAIAYNQGELEVFKDPDGRRRMWFYVPVEELKPFMGKFFK